MTNQNDENKNENELDFFEQMADQELMARTMWAEARNQGFEGLTAVCNVILNRWRDGRFGGSIKQVILKKWAFSCFNPGDPNLQRMKNISDEDKIIVFARHIVDMVLDGFIKDNTGGATHYFNPKVASPFTNKAWKGSLMEFCVGIKDHIFYRELR